MNHPFGSTRGIAVIARLFSCGYAVFTLIHTHKVQNAFGRDLFPKRRGANIMQIRQSTLQPFAMDVNGTTFVTVTQHIVVHNG